MDPGNEEGDGHSVMGESQGATATVYSRYR